ncbi:MAG: glycogen synthase GlgA [Oscillospiraceae bacterium]|nr:glycogen synthase GlgA [Oscillospiraceae bacterium]
MKILFAASEVAPFIKTGGLADVAGSLPAALAGRGHDVRVALPLYEGIGDEWRSQMEFVTHFDLKLAWRSLYCGVFRMERDGVTYYFIDNEYYFRRSQIYGHYDDGERFAYFSRAVISLPGVLDFAPDVLHCNDWQTALVPVYLLEERSRCPQLAETRSVFTIHNIEYQGRYGADILGDVFGLDRGYLSEDMLGYYGDVNLMKGAIFAADWVTTVSPSYAQELHYAFYAHGLEGVVKRNEGKLTGILNGLDVALYDPAHDQRLPKTFTPTALSGKKACKKALQQTVGLREDDSVPIVACVSRLVKHKGFDLVAAAVHDIMAMNVQMVVLGTGEWDYEETFRQTERQYPGRFSAQIMYSAPLSGAVYAGADLFLMPSVSEPCGLSQMIAMRYGTVPVVRETGGLKDSVQPYNQYENTGVGFSFANIDRHDMLHVLGGAVELWHTDKKAWKGLQKRGMTADFSWNRSAGEYETIYRRVTGQEA